LATNKCKHQDSITVVETVVKTCKTKHIGCRKSNMDYINSLCVLKRKHHIVTNKDVPFFLSFFIVFYEIYARYSPRPLETSTIDLKH